MDNVTANIKGFMKPDHIDKALSHLYDAGITKVIMSYDGPDDLEDTHLNIYKKYKSKFDTIEYIKLEFNAGLSKCRNAMIDKTDTEYILLLDDDNYIPKDILDIVKWMDTHKEMGGCGLGWVMDTKGHNRIQNGACNLSIYNRELIRQVPLKHKSEWFQGQMYWYPFHMIENTAILRKAIFDDIRWDEKYIIEREHEDFYLQQKYLSKWKFAVCATMYAYHDREFKNIDKRFKEYRLGTEADKSAEYFNKKWNLKNYPLKDINPKIFDSFFAAKVYNNIWREYFGKI